MSSTKSEIKSKIVDECRALSRWFQVRIEIRVFGKLVWSYIWPPDSVVTDADLDDFV